MRLGILTAVLLYEIVVILGVGLYLAGLQRKRAAAKESHEGDFLLSGRNLPMPVLAVTLALTVLGTVHIVGLFESSWHMGAVSLWFSFAHVILLVVVCMATGRWARRLEVTTMPELVEKLFGPTSRLVVTCVMAPIIWGILTLECQGLGIILSALTGWSIQNGAIVGAVLGVLYVILAGMKEVGWVNLINTVVMYVGLIISAVYLTARLPNGWEGVSTYYQSMDQSWMLSVLGTQELFLTFAVGITLAVVFCQGISQMLLQPAMSAKNEKDIKKAIWIAAPVNGLFGVFTVSMGLAAKTLPEFNALGPKMAAPAMLVQLLPPWLVAWLLASFFAAVLSTFAMTAMTPATIFTMDLYKNLYNPNATEADERRVTRIAIVVLAIFAVVTGASLPVIVGALNWLFAWLIPVFWLVVLGLYWKRSSVAAVTTMLSAWIVNTLWSFTSLPALLGMEKVPNAYVILVVTFAVLLTLLNVLETKPGYFKELKLKSQGAAA